MKGVPTLQMLNNVPLETRCNRAFTMIEPLVYNLMESPAVTRKIYTGV